MQQARLLRNLLSLALLALGGLLLRLAHGLYYLSGPAGHRSTGLPKWAKLMREAGIKPE